MNFLERVLRNILQKEIEDILRTLSTFKIGRNLETTDGQKLFVSFGEQKMVRFTSVKSVASRKNINNKAVPVPTFLTYQLSRPSC